MRFFRQIIVLLKLRLKSTILKLKSKVLSAKRSVLKLKVMSEEPSCMRVPFHDAVLRCCDSGTYVERNGVEVSYLPERHALCPDPLPGPASGSEAGEVVGWALFLLCVIGMLFFGIKAFKAWARRQ